MSSGIFDSSVLIDCLRGRAPAIGFLAAQSAITRPGTHLVVVAELLTGARDKSEQTLIDSFLQTFDLAVPNESDGLTALDLYRQFRLSHGVDWPDCQIGATRVTFNFTPKSREGNTGSTIAGMSNGDLTNPRSTICPQSAGPVCGPAEQQGATQSHASQAQRCFTRGLMPGNRTSQPNELQPVSRRMSGAYANRFVDESEFVDCRWRQYKRVRIRQTHAAVQTVERVCQGKPILDNLSEFLPVSEFHGLLFHGGFVATSWLKRKPAGSGCFQGVGHVHVMGPRFRPVFPRVNARISADELLVPARPRPVRIMRFDGRIVVNSFIAEDFSI
jgi:predicted nucleic acid-binding protein